jgi:hypothetical protein
MHERRVAKIFLLRLLFLHANQWGKLHYRKRASTPNGYSGYKGCCGISFRVEAPVIVSLPMTCHQACQLDSVAVVSWYIALRLVCRRG